MISIIIRTKNEERWIGPCLQAVHRQGYRDFEIILVDNASSDRTVEKAREIGVDRVVAVSEYRPGFALNEGIRASKGELIACLSGHCIPVNDRWLETLARNFADPAVGGVYGRQEPLASSTDLDKRDMMIVFGLDRRVQVKDSFFHNANSMIRRELWDRVPFDETVAHIEDRIWAREILRDDWRIVYEPEASVYHYHGIHQGADEERARGVVRILEALEGSPVPRHNVIPPELFEIAALIPVRGPVQYLHDRPTIQYPIEAALDSRHVGRVFVATDDENLASVARELGAETPFIRDASLSADYVDLERVIQYSLGRLEEVDVYPDLLVTLEATFPFRPDGLIDGLIERCVGEGLDTVIAGRREPGGIFTSEDGAIRTISVGLTPRVIDEPSYVGLKGLGCVTHTEFARLGSLFGSTIGIYEVDDPLCSFEVREPEEFEIAESLIPVWERRRRREGVAS